jgi:hypothetical protein
MQTTQPPTTRPARKRAAHRVRDSAAFGALLAGGYYIETYSGAYIDLAAPDPADIRLGDIAHALAHACRGAGHTARFFSVAEHSVIVGRRLREVGCSARVQLAGLHHDDPEAYLGDMTSPLKQLLASYRPLERRMWHAIRTALDLGDCDITTPAIKEADRWALAAENYYLRNSQGRTWYCADVYCPRTTPLDLGLSPEQAKGLWLAEHERVSAEVAHADRALAAR